MKNRTLGVLAAPSVLDPSLEAELAQVAHSASCELIHVDFKGGILKLVLDRPEGVTLADCEVVSRQTSALLDAEDFGPGRYTLEVSSPGLDRKLYRAADYERFVGRRVQVTFVDSATLRKQTVRGLLQSFHAPRAPRAPRAPNREAGEEDTRIVVMDSQSREEYMIPLKNIKLARLEIDLEPKSQGA